MVGDMPMGSYEASNELAVQSAQRLVKETGCQVVKLEAGGTSVERARAIVRSGIPVMGHVGLTPQTATALGGYKTQGKTAAGGDQTVRGCPRAAVGRLLCDRLRGGPGGGDRGDRREAGDPDDRDRRRPGDRAGQVLVYHDLLGITTGRTAKFVKRYAEIHERDGRRRAPLHRGGPLPPLSRTPSTSTGSNRRELDELRRYLDQESLTSQKAWDWEPLP